MNTAELLIALETWCNELENNKDLLYPNENYSFWTPYGHASICNGFTIYPWRDYGDHIFPYGWEFMLEDQTVAEVVIYRTRYKNDGEETDIEGWLLLTRNGPDESRYREYGQLRYYGIWEPTFWTTKKDLIYHVTELLITYPPLK